MEPMQPMQPMTPMKAMAEAEPWWPGDLGRPSSSGAQNDMKYAFFPDKSRLLVHADGRTTIYDSGDHRISGVAQQQGEGQSLAFTSNKGLVTLDALKPMR